MQCNGRFRKVVTLIFQKINDQCDRVWFVMTWRHCTYCPPRNHFLQYSVSNGKDILDNSFCLYFIKSETFNIVYSKSPAYNNLNGPGVNIKGPCFTWISLVHLNIFHILLFLHFIIIYTIRRYNYYHALALCS